MRPDRAGIPDIAPASDGTAYREYVLTETGRGLLPVIVALRQWGEHRLFRPDERRSSLAETGTGAPVARLELRSAEGRPLGWNDTRVEKPGDDVS